MDYTSGDPDLAAAAANKLAEAYIDWQRQAKLEQTKDATTWLSAQIEELRKKVSESEAAAEQFRSSNGLFEGSNNITLNAQQLSELNSQVILADAQKSEAEARARLIKKMLDENSDIDATPEVLKSELIGRLIEQRVQVQRQLAVLTATLLPSHPRIKQLNSELADVRNQIRQEAEKIVRGLENEAEVAAARETLAAQQPERGEVASLGPERGRDQAQGARARGQGQPRSAGILSCRATATPAPATTWAPSRPMPPSSRARMRRRTPSFPKRGPFSALAAAATALLALAFVLSRELLGDNSAAAPLSSAIKSRPKRRNEASCTGTRARAGTRRHSSPLRLPRQQSLP